MLIDLHTHSSQSDGSLTPEELVDTAIEQGLSAAALCDHDTTSGLDRFGSHAAARGFEAIAGIELSATWTHGNCHILGLGVSAGNGPLEEVLLKTRESRSGRNLRIIEKLNAMGFVLNIEEVEALAGGDVVGRPHIARVMAAKGHVGSVQEAFDRYLTKGAPAYVDRYRLEPRRAVELLKQAGSVVVLAHPGQLNLDNGELASFIESLAGAGLSGIEAYNPYEQAERVAMYESLAKSHGFIITGGSDFHGASKPDHRLGYWRGNRQIPYSCLEGLRDRLGA